MSFSISKNKMSFAADDLCTSRKLSNTSEQVVGKGTTHVLDTITYDATDKVHHVQFQFRAYFPSTTSAQLPEKFSVRINDSLTEQCVTTLRDYYVLGNLHASCTDPIVKLEFSVTASAASNFTMPAGSCIHFGAQPNEAVPTAASIPAPPALPVTQYFLVGFGSHAPMGHDTDPVHVTKFEERIAVINGSLPSGEPPWVLASPSTPAKTTAMLSFFDSTLIELRAHPDVTSSAEFPLVSNDHPGFSSDNAWAGGTFYVGGGSPVYMGAPIHIDFQKIQGVWTFGDGTTLAADDARWVSPNPAEDRGVMMSNGGEWGSNTVSSQAGQVRGWSSSKLKTVAIYERTV
jgi:hypothetical protein